MATQLEKELLLPFSGCSPSRSSVAPLADWNRSDPGTRPLLNDGHRSRRGRLDIGEDCISLRRARPLPRREAFVIAGVPDDEWTAFEEALAET